MCENCRKRRPHPTKTFWLDQLKEMEASAKKISETLVTTHPWIQNCIDNFELGIIPDKKLLEKEILETILEITVPREHPGAKFINQKLF